MFSNKPEFISPSGFSLASPREIQLLETYTIKDAWRWYCLGDKFVLYPDAMSFTFVLCSDWVGFLAQAQIKSVRWGQSAWSWSFQLTFEELLPLSVKIKFSSSFSFSRDFSSAFYSWQKPHRRKTLQRTEAIWGFVVFHHDFILEHLFHQVLWGNIASLTKQQKRARSVPSLGCSGQKEFRVAGGTPLLGRGAVSLQGVPHYITATEILFQSLLPIIC